MTIYSLFNVQHWAKGIEMSSVIGIGVQGIQTGNRIVANSGNEIASANVNSDDTELKESEKVRATELQPDVNRKTQSNENSKDLEQPLVNFEIGKNQVQASAKVVEAGSSAIGALLSIKV